MNGFDFRRIRKPSLIVMALFYMLAGANHFRVPDFYLPMIPPYLPWPRLLNFLSGFLEILSGAFLLWQPTRRWAAWTIVVLLLLFLSVHLYMFQERETVFADIPGWFLVARIPAQAILIYWAFSYTKIANWPTCVLPAP